MASIKTLFDKITIIRPEKIGLLGEDGLNEELMANGRLLGKEIWNSLPIAKEYPMPTIVEEGAIHIKGECFSSEDVLQSHLSTINESIKNISTILNEIQKRTKTPQSNLKKSTKMPKQLEDCQINTSTLSVLTSYSYITGKSNIEEGCEAMGIPCSLNNLINHGEILFSAYKNAAAMIEDFVTRTASMLMTEEEIKEITNHNKYYGEHFPSIYSQEDEVRKLCYKLINQGFLDIKTSIDDFVYFFSGIGEVPNNYLIWHGTNVSLSIFLDCYFIKIKTDVPSKWKHAERIFNKKNLRQSLNNARDSTKKSVVDEQYHIFTDMINL